MRQLDVSSSDELQSSAVETGWLRLEFPSIFESLALVVDVGEEHGQLAFGGDGRFGDGFEEVAILRCDIGGSWILADLKGALEFRLADERSVRHELQGDTGEDVEEQHAWTREIAVEL